MSYNNIIIYFMSGTGNSYRAAKWMGQVAEDNDVNTKVITIEDGNPEKEIENSSDNLVGIVMPTHFWTAPWHMMRFVYRLPRRKSTHAFCVATRSGLKVGPVFLNGVSGSATFIIALILALKGYSVQGIMGLSMPTKVMWIWPGLPLKANMRIINHAKVRADKFIGSILSGDKKWITWNNLYDIICAFFFFPASLGFLLVGRFFHAKLFFANNKCNSCGICAQSCPVGAIKMWGKEKPWPFWRYNCESCMRCMAFCPQKAVEVGHSWAVILYLIITIPVATYFLAAVGGSVPGILNSWIKGLVHFLYIYPAIFISYYLFYFLTRIPVINTIFTYTTLTHIFRRYHEPDTKLKEIIAQKRKI